MTLNLLRASRVNPRLSAYEQLNGVFDFNRTPLGPLGCKVIFHEMPSARGSWSPHGVEGYYIGPAMEHYRCYQVWIEETRAERTGNTLVWLPKMIPVPKTSSADAAVAAAHAWLLRLAVEASAGCDRYGAQEPSCLIRCAGSAFSSERENRCCRSCLYRASDRPCGWT